MGDHQRHRSAGGSAHQVAEQLDRRRVGPVHVVQNQQHGRACRKALEQGADGAVGPVTLVDERRSLSGRHQGPERREDRGQLEEPFACQPLRRASVERGEVFVAGVHEHREREVALELDAAAFEHEVAAPVRAPSEFREEAGLADPGLPCDRGDPGRAVRGRIELAVESRKLALPPDERLCRFRHCRKRSASQHRA
jgi:hypothetical protein